MIAAALSAGLIVALVRDSLVNELDLGSVYWAVIGLVGLGAFLRLSWFGVDVVARLQSRLEETPTGRALTRTLAGLKARRSARVQSVP
jgi:hypothetical protein